MKIDTATSHVSARRQPQSSTAARNHPASFSAALRTATADTSRSAAQSAKQADFTSMTRQQLQAWSNDQIRSGNMSLDDARPLMAMSIHIPVSGELQPGSEGERVDFIQKVRAGIEGALSRNDDVTRKMLASAMERMLQYQGETIGVDTRA